MEGIREIEYRAFKRQAALKGVDLDKDKEDEDPITRIKRKLAGDDPETNDIVGLVKAPTLQAEYGFDVGLGYKEID